MGKSVKLKATSLLVSVLLCSSLTPAWGIESAPAEAGSAAVGRTAQSGVASEVPAEVSDVDEVTSADVQHGADSPNAIGAQAKDDGGVGALSPEGELAEPGEGAGSSTSSESGKTLSEDGGDVSASVESPLPEGTYLIRSLTANVQVLDVADGSLGDSANVQLYESNMTSGQRFRAIVDEDGYYTFVNERSGKVLDVADGKSEPGTNVQQYDENGTDGQKWCLVDRGDGTFGIESKLAEGLMLDVADGVGANGSNVQVYEANEAAAQRFVFVDTTPEVTPSDPVEAGVYCLQSALDPALSLSILDRSRVDGVDACLAWSDSATSRQFAVSIDSEGYVRFVNVNSGKSLDARAGNLVPGTHVQQWVTQASGANQQWSLRLNDNGTYTVLAETSGLALDVCDAVADAGARVQLYTPNGTTGQEWRLVPVERVLEDGLYSLSTLLDGGKSVSVKDSATENGTRVELWSHDGRPAQKFRLAWRSYSVAPVSSDGSESVVESSEHVDGSPEVVPEPVEAWAVTIRPMTGTGQYLTAWDDRSVTLEQPSDAELLRQLWIPSAGPAGGVTFENVATGEMLDVSDAGTYDGCPIGTYPANGTAGQSFYSDIVDPLDQGTYVIQSVSGGRVLDVMDASRSNGANVQTWPLNGSGAQAWIVEGLGAGYYRIMNARSKKALDVADGVSAPQTNVQQYAWNGANAQRWYAVANDDGTYSFASACGGYMLDVADGGGWDGANVQIYDGNGSAAQKFRLIPTTYVPQDFEDLLGSFTTYSQNTWNGTYNMQRALDSFNGVVLQPGESMSFYGITGRCGAAEGYLPAGVVGGIGYGGGICQASTTIYGAAIRAGFDIVDRQNHSVPSVYVPIGLDAMVSWGSSDLVVRNNTEYPVKFVTYTYDNVLTCEIWGIHPEWWDYIEPVSWYTSSSSAAAQRIYYKDGSAILTEWLPSSYYW